MKKLGIFLLPGSHPSHVGLLPLEGDADGFSLLAHSHSRSSLLGTDSSSFVFVLNEPNTLSTWHQSDFLESLELAEQRRQALLSSVVRQFPQEENFVWW